MDKGKWQLAFWIITFICGTWLIGVTSHVIAANKERIADDKQIYEEMKKEDTLLRADFLVALRDMRLEQKADMIKLSDKVDDIKEDVAKIKGGMEKKSR